MFVVILNIHNYDNFLYKSIMTGIQHVALCNANYQVPTVLQLTIIIFPENNEQQVQTAYSLSGRLLHNINYWQVRYLAVNKLTRDSSGKIERDSFAPRNFQYI